MSVPFLWENQLWQVPIPIDVYDDRDKMVYTQYYVVSDDHEAAMKGLLNVRYPGIGWTSASTEHPVPYDVAVFGHGPVVPSSGCDMSFPSVKDHSHSQMNPPSQLNRPETHEGSGNASPRIRGPLFSTSSAPLHRDRAPEGGRQPRALRESMQTARQSTGGWLGSGSTRRAAIEVVQHV